MYQNQPYALQVEKSIRKDFKSAPGCDEPEHDFQKQ
ncbi:hypothetical protein ANCCAN_02977 [Ancylostoma caninum]|uniref:Uncharacterized protein n=1 Tax=Ancylostoma caninum TaxID=29170 RepID=A0A368H2Y0_ANCCA|nr:hypothetical protein ANCCAN_02977 [Ancylostoma caninum]